MLPFFVFWLLDKLLVANMESFSPMLRTFHAAGNEGLSQWLEDPTYPNTALSWNVIHGEVKLENSIVFSFKWYILKIFIINIPQDRVQSTKRYTHLPTTI